MSNKIVLKSNARLDEVTASEILSPGHLLEAVSTGKYQKHATEGDYALRAIATEDALQGKTASDAYAVDDKVQAAFLNSGDKVQAILKAGENVAIGAPLISAGDGTLIAEASVSSGVTVKDVIGFADEALNLSASGAVDTLCDVLVR